MFQVQDIYDEAKKIVGSCSDPIFFRWLADAVSLIANKGDFEGWKGYLDICTTGGRCVTLPREVETPLAVNICGRPALAYDQLFSFHLNGPGDSTRTSQSWQDQGGFHPVYRDLETPSKLVAYTEMESDNNKELIVFGYDAENKVLRRFEGGQWLNGYRVPTIYGYAVPDADAPTIARITGIRKAVTNGHIRLSTIDDSGPTGTLLGVYEPDEQNPQYRRIKLNRDAAWVRIAYRKTNPSFSSRYDHIPLKSRLAMLLAVRAVKAYSEVDVGNAHSCEADAVRLELEAQSRAEVPSFMPIQVVDMNNPQDKSDFDIR